MEHILFSCHHWPGSPPSAILLEDSKQRDLRAGSVADAGIMITSSLRRRRYRFFVPVACVSLGLQIPSKKVVWALLRRLSTFSEVIWSPRACHLSCLSIRCFVAVPTYSECRSLKTRSVWPAVLPKKWSVSSERYRKEGFQPQAFHQRLTYNVIFSPHRCL